MFCWIHFRTLLVEHHVSDHPKGRPGEPGKHEPSVPSEDPGIIITKVVDPKLEKAMQVIQTPEQDPFTNKWHPALGQINWDNNNRVKMWGMSQVSQKQQVEGQTCKALPPIGIIWV